MDIAPPRDAAEVDGVAAFMARLNRRPEDQIGFCEETPERIAADFENFGQPVLESMLIARDGIGIAGSLAFDCDEEVGRAWLYGPFVDRPDWNELADRLWSDVKALLPAFVAETELFFNIENSRCEAFGIRHGFSRRERDASVLRLARESMPDGAVAEDLMDAQRDQLVELHDRLFPNTYLPGAPLVRGLSEKKRAFVITEKGRLLAYLYGEVDPEVGYGGIDYLGVIEDRRREGHGERLIRAACAWMFSLETITDVTLSVDAGNEAARGLYAKVGFRWLFDGRAMRRSLA